MASYSGPKIVTNGLVLDIDASNPKSYPQQKNMLLKTNTPFSDNRAISGNIDGINLYTATRSIYSELYYSWTSINGNTPLFSITSGQEYTASFYIDPVDTSSIVVRIIGAGGEQYASSSISLSTAKRYYVTLIPNATVSTYAQLYIGSGNGTQIKIGGIQLEKGSKVSNYFEGPSLTTDIFDLSFYKNNATLYSSPIFTYPEFSMEGYKNIKTNNNVLQGLPDYSNSFSVSVWYKHSSLSGYTAFFEKQTGYAQRLDMGNYAAQTQYFTTWGTAGTQDIAAGFVPALNTWYNATLTASATNVSGYINGSLLVSSNVTNNQWPDYNHAVGIGGNNRKFNGSIGSTQIYNKTLSASEVLQNFNALRGKYGI